jgi:methylglyoxal synthase|tara:strand:- start:3925 stop:4194 length:270 start_codon:yes stop_codon:yes gene_type:complete
VDILCEEIKEKSTRTIGQELYHILPSFTDPMYVTDNWMYDVIDEYNVSKVFNIPVASSLESANSIRLDQFKLIANEIAACSRHQAEKDG